MPVASSPKFRETYLRQSPRSHCRLQDNTRALETGPRTIIEFVTEGLSTGTSIEFLSVYPTKEAEYLYPPLTRIKLDNHVIISQERFESLLNSETDDTGLFAKAEKQHEDVKEGIMICKMSVQIR